jgi:hypothetical protein
MFVWNAIPSITEMMSAIFFELSVIPSPSSHHLLDHVPTALTATSDAPSASWFACARSPRSASPSRSALPSSSPSLPGSRLFFRALRQVRVPGRDLFRRRVDLIFSVASLIWPMIA